MIFPEPKDAESLFLSFSPSSVIIACRGVNRDEGNDLAAHLHIDLIDPVAQVFIVLRKYAVFFKQVLCKRCLPRLFLRSFTTAGRRRFVLRYFIPMG